MSDNCTFPVCHLTMKSCTTKTTIGNDFWLGTGEQFTVVDTPGFRDSANRDDQFIQEMTEVLNTNLGYTNSIMLVVDGSTKRFSSGLQGIIKEMTAIFGSSWWDFLIIGVSNWSYSKAHVDIRKENCENNPNNCKDEAWFMREFTSNVNEKLGINRNLTFVFPDSHSQTERNKVKDQQQDQWNNETDKIWQFMTRTSQTFKFAGNREDKF